ncbi:ejaculatory bulb-specific protein 3-like [Copidosoma floridanum]|uniref:ejaculatory bulb-specific protein 3-like n=1 Tax=Copidosoma floridanum TaxID=29053 RepID=UPI0006C976BF|nr:ejaculatory bulb-specific protein 3-like [Copidosoma floridanum]
MRNACVIVFLCFAAGALAETYPNKYDNINIDTILMNDRVLNSYVICLVENKNCTREGRELRKFLPDALKTNCAKCNDHQKRMAKKILTHLKEKRSALFKRLTTTFDSSGELERKYEKEGFNF